MSRPLMVDLFSGLDGASAAMRDRGWRVVSVEISESFRPSIVADVRRLPLRQDLRPDLLWASPPCDEFARWAMPWHKDAPEPSLELVEAARAAVDLLQPRFWALENVAGSISWIRPLLGPHVLRLGPVYLWGSFPLPMLAEKIRPWKEHLTSRRKAERAQIPYPISEAFAIAVESALEHAR